MKSILVTGGCGFIGSNFIRLLLRNNGSLLAENGYDHLINLDALTYAGNRANLTEFEDSQSYRFVEGDICDQALVSSLLKRMKSMLSFTLLPRTMSTARSMT